MNTIVIGVDASERSEDAIAFAGRLAAVSDANVVVANAYPYSAAPSRASNATYRDALRSDARATAQAMRDKLEGLPEERSRIRVVADPSPARALHDLAQDAGLLIVGSTHTGRTGRVFPGSTGERLLHGAPCPIAVVPKDYRKHADAPVRTIGVAYDASDEARAAFNAAVALARALHAELELIGVVSTEYLDTPSIMGGTDAASIRLHAERAVQDSLDAIAGKVPDDLAVAVSRLTGDPAELLARKSAALDLLVMGSRGYGPLHAVLVGGLSGQLLRQAECPLLIVPRGIERPLERLFAATGDARRSRERVT